MAKKAAPKKSAAKKAAPKKSAAKKATVKKAAVKKAGTKKAGAKKSGTKKASAKKAGGIRLNDKQSSLLSKVGGAGEGGYHAEKGEAATLTALQGRKLVKRGKKDKATGKTPFHITKAGSKHAATAGGASPAGSGS